MTNYDWLLRSGFVSLRYINKYVDVEVELLYRHATVSNIFY